MAVILKKQLPGLAVSGFIASFSIYLSTLHASFDALVISIILGMMTGNFIGNRDFFREGLDSTVRVMLPIGIALYGMQLSLHRVSFSLVAGIFLIFAALFSFTMILSKMFSLKSSLSLLLASGLSICGASAIAVISPLIKARREETSISILSVMMLGLIGMIFYPLLYDVFSLTTDEFNFITGATLPMIGQVKVAASQVCPDCLNSALQIKLVRVTFLLLVVPLIAFKGGNRTGSRIRLPWFVVIFVLMSVLVNTVPLIQQMQNIGRTVSTFFFSAGLAAIGFSVDLGDVVEAGITPLLVILSAWSVLLIVIYLLRSSV